MKIVSDSLEQKIGVTRVSERDVHVSMHVSGGECGGACIHARVCVCVHKYKCLLFWVKFWLIVCGRIVDACGCVVVFVTQSVVVSLSVCLCVACKCLVLYVRDYVRLCD